MVFVGGSSVAFGLDSKFIEKKLGFPVVNMGLHANIGLRYMLDEIKQYIGKNDIVVIIPEYQQFYNNLLNSNDIALWLILDIFPTGIKYIKSPKQYFALMKSIPIIMRSKLIGGFLMLLGKFPIDPVYSRCAFNENGDVISHLDKKSVDSSKKPLFETEKLSFNNEAISVINELNSYADNSGVMVFFIFPCISDIHYGNNQEQIQFCYRRLKSDMTIPILSPPIKYTLPIENFFDTVYHLNAKGRKIRTEKVITDLAKKLNLNVALKNGESYER